MSDNDMFDLAKKLANSQQAINDIVDSVARDVKAQTPQPAPGKRTALRVAPHSQTRGEQIIEVWCDGEFVAEITAANGCGIRVFSKHEKTVQLFGPLVLQVDIRR